MKKLFNLFSLTFTIISIMVCIIFAFNCGGDDTPPAPNGDETPAPNGDETPIDIPVCDDPATIDKALPGAGTTGDPFVLCRPAHLRLIGNTATDPNYTLDKHYILGKDIALADNGPSSIGGSCGMSNAFTGSFDGRGKTISNIGFTSTAKDIYVKNLFSCLDKVKNTNYSYALSDEEVCGQVNTDTLVTREDSLRGPYIVCSTAHLNAVGGSDANLAADYVLYQDISLTGVSDSIGKPCSETGTGAFTGSFDGRGKTISNINVGFNSDKSVYAKEKSLFSCSTGVQNTNFSYISGEQVCGYINNDTLVTREDNSAGPYIVCSRAHLNAIDDSDDNLAADYVLYQDINLETDGGGNFIPIDGSFTGMFDGQGKKIMNLTISVDGDAGLFLKLGAGGTIQNLGIDNFDVTMTGSSNNNAGTLVVFMTGGRIIDCYAIDSDDETDVSGSAGVNNVGGLVGSQSGGSIISSYAAGDVDGRRGGDSVGGLVGSRSGGSIVSSYATGNVSDTEGPIDNNVGGLVGFQSGGSIISSYATGAVNGSSSRDLVGGLVGWQVEGSIISSYATGDVNGGAGNNDFVGGLVGQQTGGLSSIISSYATGAADGGEGDDFVGGLVGVQDPNSRITASYGFGTATGETNNSDTVGAPPAGGVNALTASTAGAQWGGTDSPWDFGTTSQPPALAFIMGATSASMTDDTTMVTTVTVTYSCTSPPTTAFLPAISITCGTTLLPGQR